MTTNRDFRKLVRARMVQIGECYTAARRALVLERRATVVETAEELYLDGKGPEPGEDSE